MSEPKTCFKRVDYDLSGLRHHIDIGDIGLPGVQRSLMAPGSATGLMLASGLVPPNGAGEDGVAPSSDMEPIAT
jgi:hypothetical protein